ncbi:MAG TPA: histidine kinase dimerization/phosphoacceptor domain -containing protein [Candidatus Acidoferrum sp.]|nr:histidine kinase dimerization/phosphoacceptor domain -containing protein [Candidatus Acidoferrum sp.]
MGEPSEKNGTPIVERKPNEIEPSAVSLALERRIRQQEILAELGVSALQGASFSQLLDATVRLTAEGMQAEFGKVLEHIPAEKRFLVRAGVGWEPGIVGVVSIGDDLASPAGFALRTGQPVISNHLENEERFRTPELLVQYGIHRAMNVILQGEGKPFGVLEVDSRSEHEFSTHDLAFLQGVANLLGMAIERERNERSLKAALERHQVLLKEITHRVKNSLAIVASMLKLQANEVNDPALIQHLEKAASRVSAVAKAHERIHQGDATDRLDLGVYVRDICQDLNEATPLCHIEVAIEPAIDVMTDRAVPVALIANELITNAAKYAYPVDQGGNIWVRVARAADDTIELSVRDEGQGLPADFEPRSTPGLGMRIVRTLSQQLNAVIQVRRLNPGTEFIATVPRESKL